MATKTYERKNSYYDGYAIKTWTEDCSGWIGYGGIRLTGLIQAGWYGDEYDEEGSTGGIPRGFIQFDLTPDPLPTGATVTDVSLHIRSSVVSGYTNYFYSTDNDLYDYGIEDTLSTPSWGDIFSLLSDDLCTSHTPTANTDYEISLGSTACDAIMAHPDYLTIGFCPTGSPTFDGGSHINYYYESYSENAHIVVTYSTGKRRFAVNII